MNKSSKSSSSSIHRGKQETPPRADREGVSAVFAQFGQLLQASRRPLPTQNGDGTYTTTVQRPGFRNDLKHIRMKDVRTIADLVRSKLKGEQVTDDKTMIMERVIQLVAGLPDKSRLREELTNVFINELWYTLDHPPLLYMGDKHQYRMADGSWNNPTNPQLGAAGSTYARTCRPGIVPLGALPDPSLIFESVMKRTEYRKHPNNVSSILWYWATIIIHDLFWTDQTDISKTKTSSFLDLSPLYGSNEEMQKTIRTFKDGMMKPDTYADKRLLGSPPGVSVLLIMFNRFHNYVAANLAAINEGGRFTPPGPGLSKEKEKAAWDKYDNDLFQTARLVTSGLYINITLVDYVRNIINLNRSNTTWTLDPRADMGRDAGTNSGSERGTGSMVSAEFNLCYRWHSCISAKDDQWVQDFFRGIFNKDPQELSDHDMFMGFAKFERGIPEDPAERVFGGFKRNANGAFNDDDLVNCICDSIEDCAGAFGGRNVPQAMKPVEILGILQGRKWNVAGLNEFRKHFGLKPYERFEDINSDPEISGSLRNLYEHPDYVELYPGIVAEEAKEPMVPGVGIAPTYTISRVILSDAVCLTRGDRFYTTDYHPRGLTSWGYNEVAYDLNVNQGCVFYKLFIRAFPNYFRSDSVYAHYPMVVPSETKMILTNLGRVQNFNYDRPSFIHPQVNITTYEGAQYIFDNQDKYKAIWNEGFSFLMGAGRNPSKLSEDPAFQARQWESIQYQLYKEDWNSDIKTFYSQVTDKLIREKSYKLAGQNFVDIVRDVGNIGPVHFASRVFNLPLKTEENPRGIYSEQELYMVLAIIVVCISFDIDPVKSFPLRQAAKAVAGQLSKLIEADVKLVTSFGVGNLFASRPKKNDPLAAYGTNLIKGLSKAGMSNYDIASSQIMPTAGASVTSIAEVFAQAVDYFLSPEGSKYIPELYRVANTPSTDETDALMLGYCMEGIRLAGTFGLYREVAVDDTIGESDGHRVPVRSGNRVFVSSIDAAKDAKHFPDPEKVNPRRPLDAYIHFGLGPHAYFGGNASQAGLTEMFRSVFKLKNVRRAPGAQGELKKVSAPGRSYLYMREDRGAYFPFPCTMTICYDN
ncbi:linoleate diol synthase [Hypoxylon trugodes]|uniref:linoleate diol synthase n=1 Tax=Hypoxylon trugodes TaxID=326681 RepID=UPI002198AFE4|nr:linoleate diol synthase [Hypoxylon trugodes]KAI1389341.1 linoleate diol synthase [Hypoxylon trugodes]